MLSARAFRLLSLGKSNMFCYLPSPAPPPTWLAAWTARTASPCCCVDPRSLRPPLDYTSQFAKDSGPIELTPIGWISSPYKERFGTPRQPTVDEQVSGGKLQEGEIVLAPDVSTLALRGLAGFDYCWVICYMHLNTGWRPLITPPRGPRKKQGVFATRAPHRPNHVSLSALRVISVDEDEGRVRVRGLDLLDGTPVLDIKPYVRTYDSFPGAAAGWIDDLPDDPNGPDWLAYWPPPPHLKAGAEPQGQAAAPDEEEWDLELAAEIAELDRAAEMEERKKLARLVRAEVASQPPPE